MAIHKGGKLNTTLITPYPKLALQRKPKYNHLPNPNWKESGGALGLWDKKVLKNQT